MSPYGRPRVKSRGLFGPSASQHVPGTLGTSNGPSGIIGIKTNGPPDTPGQVDRTVTDLATKKDSSNSPRNCGGHNLAQGIIKEKVLESYKTFMTDMKEKGYNIEQISEERFLKLCTNPQTGHFDDKSVLETIGGLEYELSGSVTNLRRPENSKVDLDFVAQSTASGKTIFIDHKQMIDFQTLADTKGINVENFPSHESVAFNMGRDSVKQKKRFIGIDQGPTSMNDVVHLINFLGCNF